MVKSWLNPIRTPQSGFVTPHGKFGCANGANGALASSGVLRTADWSSKWLQPLKKHRKTISHGFSPKNRDGSMGQQLHIRRHHISAIAQRGFHGDSQRSCQSAQVLKNGREEREASGPILERGFTNQLNKNIHNYIYNVCIYIYAI